MRTLVTGATGYLGRRARARAAPRDREVRALVRSTPARPASTARAPTVEGDVLDPASLEPALRRRRARVPYGRRRRPPGLGRAEAAGGERRRRPNVLAACPAAGVERVVFTSSVASRRPGRRPRPSADEGAWLIDGDDGRADFRYGRTKAAGEQAALEAAADGLDVVDHEPRLRDRAGRRPPGVVVAGRGVPARAAAVHRRRRALLRRRPRHRRRPPARPRSTAAPASATS